MRQWALVLALFLSACSQAPLVSSYATPSSAGSCRLPISITDAQGNRQGAFLSFPAGKVTVDPKGTGGGYYDRQFSRWLPVRRSSVSADGSHYAYEGSSASGQPILHIVDLAGGVDRSYSLPVDLYSAIGSIDFFEYTNDVVYMGLFGEGDISALWAFNVATGVTRRVANLSGVGVVDDKIIWLSSINAGDPHPWTFFPAPPVNQIERLDLTDGTRVPWLYRPGNLVGVIGLDAEHRPIVLSFINKETVELMTLLDADTQRTIYKGSSDSWATRIDSAEGGVVGDSHGVWFGTALGMYLYSYLGGLRKVSNQPGYPANGCF